MEGISCPSNLQNYTVLILVIRKQIEIEFKIYLLRLRCRNIRYGFLDLSDSFEDPVSLMETHEFFGVHLLLGFSSAAVVVTGECLSINLHTIKGIVMSQERVTLQLHPLT